MMISMREKRQSIQTTLPRAESWILETQGCKITCAHVIYKQLRPVSGAAFLIKLSGGMTGVFRKHSFKTSLRHLKRNLLHGESPLRNCTTHCMRFLCLKN